MRNVTLRQMRVFAAVARYGSFTRAARELHLTQPAVSQQIKLLEAGSGAAALRAHRAHDSRHGGGTGAAAVCDAGDGPAARGGRDARGHAGPEARRVEAWRSEHREILRAIAPVSVCAGVSGRDDPILGRQSRGGHQVARGERNRSRDHGTTAARACDGRRAVCEAPARDHRLAQSPTRDETAHSG